MELDEGVYERVERFVNRPVLVYREEVERPIELSGFLCTQACLEVLELLLVPHLVLLSCLMDFGELRGGFVGFEFVYVEGVAGGAIHYLVDECGHVPEEYQAQPVLLDTVGGQIFSVLVQVKHEPAEVYLIYQDFCVSLVLIPCV